MMELPAPTIVAVLPLIYLVVRANDIGWAAVLVLAAPVTAGLNAAANGTALAPQALWLALVVIGAAGPLAAARKEYSVAGSCGDARNCTLAAQFSLDPLTPWNQATWLVARIQRPLDAASQPALQSVELALGPLLPASAPKPASASTPPSTPANGLSPASSSATR